MLIIVSAVICIYLQISADVCKYTNHLDNNLWNSSLEQVVSNMEGRRVDRGDDNHGDARMAWHRAFGEVERDMDPALIEHSDRLQMA